METTARRGERLCAESHITLGVIVCTLPTADVDNGARLTTATDFPDGEHATITLSGRAACPFTLAIRRPGWAGDGFVVCVNGERMAVPPVASLRAGGAGGRDLGLDEGTLPPSS